MDPIVVIGDEAACAGFRLAGVAAVAPAEGELAGAFEDALGRAQVVLLTRGCADRLPPELLQHARVAGRALLAVIPDLADADRDSGLERRIRAILGVEP